MEIKKAIGTRLKEMRLLNGLTQKKLSNLSGIERTFISHIEKGKRNVTIDTIQKITSALRINIKTFFNSNFFK